MRKYPNPYDKDEVGETIGEIWSACACLEKMFYHGGVRPLPPEIDKIVELANKLYDEYSSDKE